MHDAGPGAGLLRASAWRRLRHRPGRDQRRARAGTGPLAVARAGEVDAGTSLPSRQGSTVGRLLDSRRRRQLGAGKGLSGVQRASGPRPLGAARGAARVLDPRWSESRQAEDRDMKTMLLT